MEKELNILKMEILNIMEYFVKINIMRKEYYIIKMEIFPIMGLGCKTKRVAME